MEEGKRPINKKGLAAFIGVTAVLLIILVVAAFKNINPGPQMIRQNENTKEFTQRDLVRIENSVIDILKHNYGYTVDEIKKFKIELRDVKAETMDGTKMLSFLIDVVDLELTLDGATQSGLDEEYVYLGCPTPEKAMNKSVFCAAYGGESTVNWTLADKLPYVGLMNDTYVVEVDMNHDGESADLDAAIQVCDAFKPTSDEVRAFVREWIKTQTDFDANAFPIKVTYFDCEGQKIL